MLQRHDLPPEYFGEGIVDWGSYLLEWTWKSHICFVYDRQTFRRVTQFSYKGEGWGMTRTPTELITRDGTATLRFRDPSTFQINRSIVVKDGRRVIERLNELEFIKGEIYANVWQTDRIARISPRDGRVIAWIDLSGLLPSGQVLDADSVLNGIAYDAQLDASLLPGNSGRRYLKSRLFPVLPRTCMSTKRGTPFRPRPGCQRLVVFTGIEQSISSARFQWRVAT